MVRLRDGCELTVWPRWLVAVGPDRPPMTIDQKWLDGLSRLALAQGCDEAETLRRSTGDWLDPGPATPEPDPWLLERLRALDRLYGAWLSASSQAPLLGAIEDLHARRRVYHNLERGWPTLPVSTLVRRNAITALAPGRVVLFEDPDGLGLLLAPAADVTCVVTSESHRGWLGQQAERLGVSERVRIAEAPPSAGGFELAVGTVSSPGLTHDLLTRVSGLLAGGGHLLLSLRHPWDGYVYPWLTSFGFEVVRYLRDVDHAYVPGGFSIDGGADLVLLRRSPDASAPVQPPDEAASARAQPYALIEVESLSPERLGVGAIDRLIAAVDAMAPTPRAMRDSLRDAERDVVWWYDLDGHGFSAELRRDKAHLAVALAPYHAGLAAAVCCAAAWTLGDEHTRTFPLRTTRSPEQVVLA
jgi:hypothetical protein